MEAPPYVVCGGCGQIIVQAVPVDILEHVRADLLGATMARQNEVASGSGVPFSTLRKIVDGRIANPRYDTVERLRSYYRKQAHAAGHAASTLEASL